MRDPIGSLRRRKLRTRPSVTSGAFSDVCLAKAAAIKHIVVKYLLTVQSKSLVGVFNSYNVCVCVYTYI